MRWCGGQQLDLAALKKLKPVFKPGGSTTAGNSSQMSDGAAAVLMARRSVAVARGLTILGTFRSFAVAGVDPAHMGIGPSVAIPAALARAKLGIEQIKLIELNEAFASQALMCCRALGLDQSRVNVNGGGIALGHPIGCTGARCVVTLLHEMLKQGPECEFGVVSMCIGTGMGAAAVLGRS
ncbi:3-ketoacyl-CoA thiolase 2, peroxisomal [Cymbomonas tetramitiformis]|uniref:acetyl-CoA C-acyltransferase n=1 Tax=Cymbomonas tetramitiformis TaxID=36881 RepID=A0AAE0BPF7_9CHLO|nr:3-ketoacyl-CoA thiolase 2, peroxisomal [Cymbomonas tetramitiformis]